LDVYFKSRWRGVVSGRIDKRYSGVSPRLLLSEQEIYGDLLVRKPGADELSSPRKEPDLPIIYSGLNAADTIENAGNRNHTNGTPLAILIPNLIATSLISSNTRTRTGRRARACILRDVHKVRP